MSLSMPATRTVTRTATRSGSRPTRPAAPPRWTLRLTMLTVLLIAATLLGGVRVAALVTRPDPMTLQMGRTTMAVTHVEQVTGLTADDLSGMSHGIQGLVQDDQAMLRVSLTVSAGSHATDFDISRLRLHSSASRTALLPVGGSVGRGHLSAHARVDGAVSFIVPRNGARFVLRGLGATQSVPLTKVDLAPASAGHMNMNMRGGAHTSPARP
jgi:hypothetical protein